MELNINVKIGITAGLAEALAAVASGMAARERIESQELRIESPERAGQAAAPAEATPEAPIAAAEQPAESAKAEGGAHEARSHQGATLHDAGGDDGNKSPKPVETIPFEGGPFTAADVRAAMDRTRRRIEGEDWQDNTSSEGYRRYHKALSTAFMNLALQLGGTKPSALPENIRWQFIADCNRFDLDDNGEIIYNEPF